MPATDAPRPACEDAAQWLRFSAAALADADDADRPRLAEVLGRARERELASRDPAYAATREYLRASNAGRKLGIR